MLEVIIDCISPAGSFSVRKLEYVEAEDGSREYIGEPERRAFCPGQLDDLREYAPEAVEQAAAIWTAEIAAEWKAKQAEMRTARSQ